MPAIDLNGRRDAFEMFADCVVKEWGGITGTENLRSAEGMF